MSAHHHMGPSSWPRGIACPLSWKFAREQEGEEEAGPDAKLGTACHALAEKVFHSDSQRIEPGPDTADIPDAYLEMVQQYVDYLVSCVEGQREFDTPDSTPSVYTECELSMDFPKIGLVAGTADAVIYDPAQNTLEVCDFKTGSNPVAPDSVQILAYLAMAAEESPAERFFASVFQPKCGGLARVWVSRSQLQDVLWDFGIAALNSLQELPEAHAGAHCRYCKGLAQCKEHSRDLFAAVEVFDSPEIVLTPVDVLSLDQCAKYLKAQKAFEAWFKAIYQRVAVAATEGKAVPGWKLVEGRSMRKWIDEAEAEQALVERLGEKAYIKKLLSVAQAEKALPSKVKKEVMALAEKPKGKIVLALETDKRPGVSVIPGHILDFASDILGESE